MVIKDVADMYDRLVSMSTEEALGQEGIENTKALLGIVSPCADEAQEIITRSVDEALFCKFLKIVQKLGVSVCGAEGQTSVLIADMKGDLTAYTHTVILTVIGALIQDEVL